MHTRLLRSGLVIWFAATIALRLAGQHLLRPADPVGTFILFAVSFPLMAWLVRRLCIGAHLLPEQFIAGAVSVALPTLLLDPFPCCFQTWLRKWPACSADGCCGAAPERSWER